MLPRRTVFLTEALVRDTVVVGRVAVVVVDTDAVDTVLEDVEDMVQGMAEAPAQCGNNNPKIINQYGGYCGRSKHSN